MRENNRERWVIRLGPAEAPQECGLARHRQRHRVTAVDGHTTQAEGDHVGKDSRVNCRLRRRL